MGVTVSEELGSPLPMRPLAARKALGWPVCGRVVDVSGGPEGHAVRCHLSHGHRGECDELGSAELQYWQSAAEAVTPPQPATLDDVRPVALAHARTYEAMAHWKRERGWALEAERLDAMAEALRHLVKVLSN